MVDVDNITTHDAFKKGRSRNLQTHDLITKLLVVSSKGLFHPGAPLGMLRGELGGRQFDQTRTHGARPAISGGIQ